MSTAFRAAYESDASASWTAPGRVNLIGEHTDYNDGFVLPLALEQSCVIAASPARSRKKGISRLRSTQRPGEEVTFRAGAVEPGDLEGWAGYVAGTFWSLRELGYLVPDLDVLIDSDVPVGAGLSSSAALECATATMLIDMGGLLDWYAEMSTGTARARRRADVRSLPRTELALAAQRAENEFVGAPTGSMDQLASMHGRKDHVCFIDTRSTTVVQVPFDLSAQGLALLVIDTRAPHQLVDSEYGDRRRGCESAARELGVAALRDVTFNGLEDTLRRLSDEHQRAYVRHVVTENARVLDVVELLATGQDPREIGPALTASHVSLRDDFRVSVPQLDVAVEAALSTGAYGARMTGGGFGGCAIALVDVDAVDRVTAEVRTAFDRSGFDAPESFVAVPSDGARLVTRFGNAHANS